MCRVRAYTCTCRSSGSMVWRASHSGCIAGCHQATVPPALAASCRAHRPGQLTGAGKKVTAVQSQAYTGACCHEMLVVLALLLTWPLAALPLSALGLMAQVRPATRNVHGGEALGPAWPRQVRLPDLLLLMLHTGPVLLLHAQVQRCTCRAPGR